MTEINILLQANDKYDKYELSSKNLNESMKLNDPSEINYIDPSFDEVNKINSSNTFHKSEISQDTNDVYKVNNLKVSQVVNILKKNLSKKNLQFDFKDDNYFKKDEKKSVKNNITVSNINYNTSFDEHQISFETEKNYATKEELFRKNYIQEEKLIKNNKDLLKSNWKPLNCKKVNKDDLSLDNNTRAITFLFNKYLYGLTSILVYSIISIIVSVVYVYF